MSLIITLVVFQCGALSELAEPGSALSRRAVAERLGPLSVQLTSIYSHINERIDELSQGAGGNGSAMRRAPYDALYGNTRRAARSTFGTLVHDGFTCTTCCVRCVHTQSVTR